MKQATVRVKLSKEGNDAYVNGVTPIEALLLTAEHHQNAGGCPLTVDEKTVKDVVRTDEEEVDRLRMKYSSKKINALLSVTKTFPSDYKTALEKGIKMIIPSSPLLEQKLI